MTKWKQVIASKLKPMYEKICHPGQMGDILIPSDNDHFEQYLYFSYQADVTYDDIYGDNHILKNNSYVSCYYVEESEDGNWENDAYIEVARTFNETIQYLVNNFAMNRLLQLKVGCVDDIGMYG